MTIEKINDKLAQCEAILWKWSTNNENKHPVKIRVTFNRKAKYFSAQHDGEKIFVSPDQWGAINEKAPRGNNRKIAEAIAACLGEAKKAVKIVTANGKQFTFDKFEKCYVNKTVSGGFFVHFENYLAQLAAEGRIGTHVAYKNALSALKAFRKDKDFNPAEMTVTFLKDLETFLRKTRGVGSTTVAMYMRAIKVVYNMVADVHPELKQDYPFAIKQNDRNRYQIPANSGQHKGEVLSVDTLKSFISLTTEPGTQEHSARLTFLFSFYAQGMNMRDIANLKYENITADSIQYKRQKTERTSKESGLIQVPLNDELRSLIAELSTDEKFPGNFVFPILNHNMDAIARDKAVRQFIKITNKYIKSICEANQLPVFTTYSARHSYASMMKFAGVKIEMIRELLGHTDIRTTENYLKRFDIDTKKEANENIMRVLKSA